MQAAFPLTARNRCEPEVPVEAGQRSRGCVCVCVCAAAPRSFSPISRGRRAALGSAPARSPEPDRFRKARAAQRLAAVLGLFLCTAVFGLNSRSAFFFHSAEEVYELPGYALATPPVGFFTPSPLLSPANSPLPWKSRDKPGPKGHGYFEEPCEKPLVLPAGPGAHFGNGDAGSGRNPPGSGPPLAWVYDLFLYITYKPACISHFFPP